MIENRSPAKINFCYALTGRTQLCLCIRLLYIDKYMLFTGWEARIGRNCALGLVPSLHRFRLQCNCNVLSLPLFMFVVAVLMMLPSLC